MKKYLVVLVLLMFCSIPVSLFAEGDAVDQGSIEFGLGQRLCEAQMPALPEDVPAG